MPYPVPPDLPDFPTPHELRDDVRLIRPTVEHADQVAEAVQPFDIRRFTLMPDPYVRDDAKTWLEGLTDGKELTFLLEQDGRVVGGAGLMISWQEWSAEVGYWLVEDARGRGLMTDTIRLLCAFAFDQVGLRRIQLRAAETNTASNALAQRLGFVREGVLRSAHIDGATGRPDQPRADMYVWGLLPGELVRP